MDYPNVICEQHPDEPPAPGYCVCRHVRQHGAAIADYQAPTPRALGAVLCDACATRADELGLDDLIFVCATCVDALLAAKAPRP